MRKWLLSLMLSGGRRHFGKSEAKLEKLFTWYTSLVMSVSFAAKYRSYARKTAF